MTLNTFIPSVWSSMLLENLFKDLVYAGEGRVNRDYEGDVAAYGDTVKIHNIGPVTIRDYVKNTDMGAPDVLTDGERILSIDQAKSFNFAIDNIDRAQQNPKVMEGAIRQAAYNLAEVADEFVANLYTDPSVPAGNLIGSEAAPVALQSATPTAAYNLLVQMKTKLDRNNVPKTNRTVTVPPEFEALLLQDSRFVQSFDTQVLDQALLNGQVGRIAGFKVLTSNNVPTGAGGDFKVQATYDGAITYADQIAEVKAYEPQGMFADALKGLHVYGAKLVRPEALVVACVTIS